MARHFLPRRARGGRMLVTVFVACFCLVGATPTAASADATAKMMKLCADGQSLAGFTVKQYQRVLEHLPTEVIEYKYECVEEIQEAELAAASHKGAWGSSGSSDDGSSSGGISPRAGQPVEPTPTQERILEAARTGHAPAVRLGRGVGESLSPGVVQPDLASAASDLPAAVLAVVAAVICGILLLAGHEIHERMRRSRHS